MRRTVARLLRGLGLLRYDMLAREQPTHPDPASLPAGELVVVRDGEHLKWACMRCPGGCGAEIKLSLNPVRRPRWTVTQDWFGRPSVTPSVHRKEGCGCHFWIRRGQVEWCRGGHPGGDGVPATPRGPVPPAQTDRRLRPFLSENRASRTP